MTTKIGTPRIALRAGPVKPSGRPDRRDLVAARDQVVDAPEDAEGAQRRDDRRHLEHGHEEAVHHAQPEADRDPHEDGTRTIEEVALEGDRDAVGDQAHHRLDREVDVAGDHDERLADGGHGDDRGERGHLAQVADGEELGRRQRHQRAEHDHDGDEGQLALARDRTDQRASAGSPPAGTRRRDRFSHERHWYPWGRSRPRPRGPRRTRPGRCRSPRTSRLPRSLRRARSRR